MRECDVERYLVVRVNAYGGEVRKVAWLGRNKAPDRVVMLPWRPAAWFEVKGSDTIETFPANEHERGQQREHARLRSVGQPVYVVGTFEQVDAALSEVSRMGHLW